MKIRYSAIALVLALSAGSALAADLPAIKGPPPPPPPPPPIWTGFYVGLNAGYGWGGNNQSDTATFGALDPDATILFGTVLAGPPAFTNVGNLANGGTALANSGIANVNQNGFIGGAQFGYNYQWGASWLVGFEADIQGAGIRGSGGYSGTSADAWTLTYPQGGTTQTTSLNRTALGVGEITAGVDWLGTVRGRLGWLATPTLLVYGTGGLAYGGVRATAFHSLGVGFSASDTGTLGLGNGLIRALFGPGSAGHFSDTRVGWTAGGGLEWLFTPNWSVKAEALYYDLGTSHFASSPIAAGTVAAATPFLFNTPVTRVRFDGVIARVGVNYHFIWAAPPAVVARY